MEKFRKLGLNEQILKSLQEQQFEVPSEIQEKAIPLALEGKDIIAKSATGSGKTLVFAAGILHNIKKAGMVQALVLTPTRELAEQISQVMKKMAKYQPLFTAVIYGGVSINPQIDALKKADVVIGTPGRVLDHLKRKTLKLQNVKILVLDEADRMLDMGFIDDVETIMRECPRTRQTLFFSATISADIAHLSKKYMNEPVKIAVASYVDATKLKQVYYDVPSNMKFSLLVHLLKKEKGGLVMIFCNSRRNTDFVANNLEALGMDAIAIHGGLSQDKRNNIMKHFHSRHACVLVCTDVAARGLDIKDVSHVYNYDIPRDSKQYIHRIGRTARAGKEGIGVNILTQPDHENFTRVLKEHRDLTITKMEIPEIERVHVAWKGGQERGSSGGRPSSPRRDGPRSYSSERRGPPRRSSHERPQQERRRYNY